MKHTSSVLRTSAFLLLIFFARASAAEKPQSDQASAIADILHKAMRTEHLRAVILKVTQGNKVVISQAFGESKIAIAVARTFTPEAFDSQGNYANSSNTLFRLIGAYMVPDDAPPMPGKG